MLKKLKLRQHARETRQQITKCANDLCVSYSLWRADRAHLHYFRFPVFFSFHFIFNSIFINFSVIFVNFQPKMTKKKAKKNQKTGAAAAPPHESQKKEKENDFEMLEDIKRDEDLFFSETDISNISKYFFLLRISV